MTNDEIIERIISRLPYPEHITEINSSTDGEIRFSWRGQRFVVDKSLHVSEVGTAVSIGSNTAILMRQLFK